MIIIRHASLSDVNQLYQLFDNYRIFYKKEPDLNKASDFIYERITKGDSVIFVAQALAGTLAGFVQLYPIFSSTKMQRLWLLNDLFVEEDFRGLGISIKLIEKAKQHAVHTNACGLILETAKSNTIGNKLYSKTGFKLDKLSNYYTWSG